jgi:hypothetical protein
MVLQLWESRSSPTLIRSLLRNQGASSFYTNLNFAVIAMRN